MNVRSDRRSIRAVQRLPCQNVVQVQVFGPEHQPPLAQPDGQRAKIENHSLSRTFAVVSETYALYRCYPANMLNMCKLLDLNTNHR